MELDQSSGAVFIYTQEVILFTDQELFYLHQGAHFIYKYDIILTNRSELIIFSRMIYFQRTWEEESLSYLHAKSINKNSSFCTNVNKISSSVHFGPHLIKWWNKSNSQWLFALLSKSDLMIGKQSECRQRGLQWFYQIH